MPQLSELCEIRSGYTARGKLQPLSVGGVPALQFGDVDRSGEPVGASLQKYHLGALDERYFVRGGEVVFRSRGEPSTAAVVDRAMTEAAVVIVPLIIVRPDESRLLAEYLAWVINHPVTQRRLGTEAQGTSLRMISVRTLKKLDIAVPGLCTQRRIVELDALAKTEKRLSQELAGRRETLVNAVLARAATAADQKELAR